MSKNCRLPDYTEYHFQPKEGLLYMLEGILIVAAVGCFFYHSWIACLCLAPVLFLFLKEKKRELAKKRRQELSGQFKDMVLALAANQKAGYSIENAVREAYRDMEMLYGEEGMICVEIRYIIAGLENNVVLEKLIYSLGMRSGLPDILQFADIFAIAKRSGGNMTDILTKTAVMIEQKTDTDKEIQLMLGARKTEQKIMNLIPFFMILYIDLTSPGFFRVMYETVLGRLVMSACLAAYLLSLFLAARILNIRIG